MTTEIRETHNLTQADRAFRDALRNTIAAARIATDGGRRPQVLGVTSPRHGEGKTTFAMALAGLLAADLEVDVALIDADFDTHSLGEAYDLDARTGLADVLAGEQSVKAVMQRIAGTRLDVIAAGTLPSDVGHLAQSGKFRALLDELREYYPFIVLDLPGVLSSASARILARSCDGVIVVAETNRTNVMDLGQSLERLEDSNVLGVVLNKWRSSIPARIERLLGLNR